MPKKRAKRKTPQKKKGAAMTGLRSGFKGVVGTGGGKKKKSTWVDWFWWILLGVAVALLMARAMS